MVKIEFLDGTMLDCEGVHSSACFYQGTSREAYTFLFDPEIDLNELSSLFVPERCDKIIIHTEDGESFAHKHFTIRYGYGCSTKESALDEIGNSMNVSSVGQADDPQKVFVAWVKMIQTTLSEQMLMQQQEVIDNLLIAELARNDSQSGESS